MSTAQAAWSEEALDYVQAVADTKLVLGHRFAELMATGQSIEDDVANMNLAQEEFGHVRQLFRRLEEHGRDRGWLEHERDPGMYANASVLDEPTGDWPTFVVRSALVDRAAWLLLDAVAHPDLDGIREKIAQEESYHLDRADGWLEYLAGEEPEAVQEALEETLPGVLAFLGPAQFDAEEDPLFASGFTDAPVAALRERFLDHLEAVLADTEVNLPAVDRTTPDPAAWDAVRRRENGGSIAAETASVIQGNENREFAVE